MFAEASLDVMTLNTWGFRWPLARDRSLRFGRIAEHLADVTYDIVGLQEMWAGAAATLGQTALRWLKRPQWLDKRRGHRMEDSGLAVKLAPHLSDGAEVRADLVRPYSKHRSWDRIKFKGLYAVDVDLGDAGQVTVVTTHLQAGRKYAKTRRSQVDELLATTEKVSNPIILMGDFNFHADNVEDRAGHAALTRAGFADAAESLDRPEPTYLKANPYVPTGDRDERFDRFYLRDGDKAKVAAKDMRVIVDHANTMSDHEALSARIVVTPI